MSAPSAWSRPCAAAIGRRQRCMLHCVRIRGAGPAQHRGASPRRSRAAVRRSPCAGPQRDCGDVRGVCPILVLVDRLQKEHPA